MIPRRNDLERQEVGTGAATDDAGLGEEALTRMTTRQNFEAAAMTDVRTEHPQSTDGAARHEQCLQRLIDRLPLTLRRMVRWLRRPSSRWVRLPAGVLLVCGGLLSILPFLGIWMLPLGLVLLAEDIAPLRRARDRLLDRIERRHPQWMKG